MRTVEELVSSLSALGVRLWGEDGRLRFSAPQGVLTPTLRAEMAERKVEILSLLEEAAEAAEATIAPIPLVPRADDLPLSFAEQRLWYLHQLDPASSAYNAPVAVRLIGRLDRDALQKAIDLIVERHEALRTVFPDVDGKPTQRILPSQPVEIALIDLRSAPQAAREEQAMALSQQAAREPFVLATGPLLRVTLVQLADDEHFLVLAMHHIVSDGWSLGVLLRELAGIYNPLLEGNSPSLPALPIQYADFARWQRDRLQGSLLDRQTSYWTQQLKDIPRSLDLPTDRPRPSDQTYQGAVLAFTLRPATVEGLRALARQTDATLFMVLLAAFYVLLFRYTGQDDIVVGSPIHGRTRPELRDLIGCFINTLALRGNLSEEPTFLELVARVRAMTLMAFEHQELPFEKLVEALHPTRDLGRSPLFQTMFVLQNLGMQTPDLRDLSVAPLWIETGSSAFDLTLTLLEMGDDLSGAVEYSRDLFDESTIRRMIGHYETLLGSAVTDPRQRITKLTMLAPAEELQLVEEWNRTTVSYPARQCIHELVAAQAERTPDAVAIQCGATRLTYRELNRRANQLARHLQSMGVVPGQTIGIMMERSPELYQALLGILKAGAAFVPIDPSYPHQRIAYIAEDARLSVLLTQATLKDALPTMTIPILFLDADGYAISRQDDRPMSVEVTAEQWAYVIYTSGSTGKPKGVPVCHRSLVNYTHAARDLFALDPADRVLQFASFSFDTAAEEIFPAWTCGATVVARSDLMLASASAFLQACDGFGISVLDLPTSYWHQMVMEMEAGRLELPDSLRLVVIGGEKALPQRVVTWQRLVGASVRLLNTYGPTEATIVATAWELRHDWGPDRARRQVPIGQPIANVRTYVLDAALNPVPIGVSGELYIGGAGVADGYLNQPELTRLRFLPDPFVGTPGSLLYRTGDRVCYRPDGNLDYLGRTDDQVKLRGFRIEPGEIEANLLEHPDVREVIVLLREDQPGDKRLVAYIVTKTPGALAAESLRQFAGQRLPAHMVPSAFEFMDALPLTVSGKIDRNALPAPQRVNKHTDHSEADDATRRRSDVETTLAAIWAAVLGLEHVGRHDNFFELGGDSILSIQVVARANQAGLHLNPKQFLQAPTVAEQAILAGRHLPQRAEQGLVTGEARLTPIQRWFFAQAFPEPHHWNQAILLQLTAPVDHWRLREAVASIIVHHDLLRARFEQRYQTRHQTIGPVPDQIPYAQVDLCGLPAEQQAEAIRTQAAQVQASLNYETGPLLRVVHFDLGPDTPSRLLLVIHHLVVDTFSWRILLDDLLMAYSQLQHGAVAQLPAKTTSYRQWSDRLIDYATSASLVAELDFWREQGQPTTPLPTDFPQGGNTEALAQNVVASLGVAKTRLLIQQVPQAYQTRIMDVLLTAMAQTLMTWTGGSVVQLELEGHGREDLFEDVDVSRTVGWFTTLFPVRLDLSDAGDPGSALKKVKEQLRRIPKGGIGYGILNYLSPHQAIRASLEAQPIPQVLFNYLGQLDRAEGLASPFQPAEEDIEPSRGLRNQRSHLLEVSGSVVAGNLTLQWRYSAASHRRSTVDWLARTYQERLNALIDHCISSGAGGYTPSDFPAARASQQELDKLVSKLKRQGKS